MIAKRSALSQQVTTRQQWADAKAWQTQYRNNTNDPPKKYRLGTVSKSIYWLEGLNQFHLNNFQIALSSDFEYQYFAFISKLTKVSIYFRT